jgi:cation diffusion facilitator family transporter
VVARADSAAVDESRSLTRTAALSVASNTVLVIAKTAVGLATGALSVLSEALHSASDLLASIIALIAVSVASKPADDRHQFGHGKYESLSATLEGLLLFGAAGWIMAEAAKRLHEPPAAIVALPGIIVMAVGVALNIVVSTYLLRVARRYKSPALEADGVHLRADVWTSAAVLAGLGLLKYGAPLWVDSLLGVVVAIVVVYEGVRLVVAGVTDLLDAALPASERDIIEEVLGRHAGGPYVGYHKLRTRHSGRRHEADVHVVVCQQLTVGEAHQITEEIQQAVGGALPNTEIVVHMEPCEEADCLDMLRQGLQPVCKRRGQEGAAVAAGQAEAADRVKH